MFICRCNVLQEVVESSVVCIVCYKESVYPIKEEDEMNGDVMSKTRRVGGMSCIDPPDGGRVAAFQGPM